MALRVERARQRAERRETLLVLLARVDRLSPTEGALLVEYVHAELAASDELRRTVQGLQRAVQEAGDRLLAAEAAIVEAETDRDHATARADKQYEDIERLGGYLNAARRELGGVPWPDVPYAVRQLVAELTEYRRDSARSHHPEQ